MIVRYHEAPISIFERVQEHSQGDYALVHLLEQSTEYCSKFEEAIKQGRDVILDNSLFELGKAFDAKKYASWVEYLKPTWYIVPDSWKNGPETVAMFNDFINKYPNLPGKRIGVAQGRTFAEVAECYMQIEPLCDMVAFNLDFSSYANVPTTGIPYCLRMSIGRYKMLSDLLRGGVINQEKPHHLLGCGVPQEMIWYPKRWTWLRSMDTCNPVAHGLTGHLYDHKVPGMLYKMPLKMCDMMFNEVSEEQWSCIEHNLREFENFESLREEK